MDMDDPVVTSTDAQTQPQWPRICASVVLGASVGAGLLLFATIRYGPDSYLRFTALGGVVGGIIGMGVVRHCIPPSMLAPIIGALSPYVVCDLNWCDGSVIVAPVAGAVLGWALGRVIGTISSSWAPSI